MRLIQLKQIAGGGIATGVPNAAAFFNGSGSMTSVPDYLAGALDAFSRPAVRDFRLGPGRRGAVYKLGAWGVDGDPQNVTSEGYVTYGPNALGNGPDGTQGGLGFYEPNGFGPLQIIPGVNGGNPFYSCGFEDGGPAAPFGLDGFIVNDNNAAAIAWIKRSDNTSNFRTVTTGLGGTPAKWSAGAGVPNGAVIGSPGDIYSNTTGGTGTTLWTKESGVATNTGWVSLHQSSIYWAAGVPWANIRAQILALAPVPGPIYLDPSAVLPYVAGVSGEVTDLHGMWFEVPILAVDGGVGLEIADGAQLRNLGGNNNGGVRGLTFVGMSTGIGVTPPLAWDVGSGGGAPYGFLIASGGGSVRNDGTVPMVQVPAGMLMIAGIFQSGAFNDGAFNTPIVQLGAGAFVIVPYAFATTANIGSTVFGGGAGEVVGIENLGGFDFTTIASWSNFTGTVFNIAFDLAGGSGPTAYRPFPVFGPLGNGVQYFDTDIGYPVWWNVPLGFWVNAAGVGPQ
jgi:hypothetical protein